ncbi:restriction endonuclease subunit S, partial [Pedobacter glucosidilyticus]|uniref:restriction endonuclease subunit S n=1 Tax=Pedobacter glucosidilyticus TaxID=1122941 RepID=UPI00047BCB95
FLSLPKLQEQNKISSFLSLLDERITTQNKIIENLKTQIHGVQEKIFRQKIKLKNEDGAIFSNWEFIKGGELFESISDKKHNSDLPILAITQEQGAVPRDLIDYQITVTEKSVESYKVVEIGDFIISLRSFQGGIEYSNYKGICSPAYIVLRSKTQIELDFYKYYFKSPDYITSLNKKLEGIRDGKMISYSYFSEIFIPFPPIEEQEKIAKTLNVINKKIETEKKILKQLEKQKQYLLSNIFV